MSPAFSVSCSLAWSARTINANRSSTFPNDCEMKPLAPLPPPRKSRQAVTSVRYQNGRRRSSIGITANAFAESDCIRYAASNHERFRLAAAGQHLSNVFARRYYLCSLSAASSVIFKRSHNRAAKSLSSSMTKTSIPVTAVTCRRSRQLSSTSTRESTLEIYRMKLTRGASSKDDRRLGLSGRWAPSAGGPDHQDQRKAAIAEAPHAIWCHPREFVPGVKDPRLRLGACMLTFCNVCRYGCAAPRSWRAHRRHYARSSATNSTMQLGMLPVSL